MSSSYILKSSIFILILSNSGNFINLIFNLLLSKYLHANEYSLFTSLSSFYIAILTPFSGLIFLLQLKINKFKSDVTKMNEYIINISKLFLLIGFFFLIIVFFSYSKLVVSFKTTNMIIFLFYLFFLVSLMTVVPISILNSFKKYLIPHFSNLINDSIRIIILIFSIFIYSIKYNIFISAILATLTSLSGHFLLNTFFALRVIEYKKFNFISKLDLSTILDSQLIKTFLYMLSLSALTNLDLVFSRIFFEEQLSANYNLASFISKSIYFLPSVLFSFLFNEQINKNKNSKYGIIFIIFINLIGLLLILVLYNYFIDFFYDGQFDLSKKPIKFLAPSMVLLSMIIIYFNKLMSLSDFSFLYIIILSSLSFIFLCFFFHTGINSLAINLLFSILILYIYPIIRYAFK